MRKLSFIIPLLLLGVASALLLGYVSNIITFQTTISKLPIEISVISNELEEEEIIGGNTYEIVVNTRNLANNEIGNLRTVISCKASPDFESGEELSVEAYFIDRYNNRDPPSGTYVLEKKYLEDKSIEFYIPSSTSTWTAYVNYNTTGYFYVTTAPDIQPGTQITCTARVNIIR